MGNVYCCNAPQPDKRFEINYINGNGMVKSNSKNRYDDEKNSTAINPSNYNFSDEALEADHQKALKNKMNFDYYEEEQFDSVIKNEIVKISKTPSIYKENLKQKYILFSKLFDQKNKYKFDKQKKQKFKQDLFNKMFTREVIINQKDQLNAKYRLENFLDSPCDDYTTLQKFHVWFDEEWYEEQDEILRVVKDLVVNLPCNLDCIVLNFWGMKLGIEGTRQFVKGLKKQTALQNLDLNMDTGEVGNIGANQLGNVLNELKTLQILKFNLSANDIDYIGMEKLCKGLQNLNNLVHLDLILQENQIGHDGGIKLAESIQKLVKLKKFNLNLGNNQLGDNAVQQITLQVFQLPVLGYIYLGLSGNNITEDGLNKMKNYIMSVDQLKYTDIILGLTSNPNISLKEQQQFETSLKKYFPMDKITLYVFF